MQRIVLSKELFDNMLSHCRSEYPKEACGIFSGKGGIALRIYPMPNIENSPVSYMADPKSQFTAMKDMREKSEDMVSIYHSHPNSLPYPSGKDLELAFYPEAVYMIVGLADYEVPEVRAYTITGGVVKEAGIDILS